MKKMAPGRYRREAKAILWIEVLRYVMNIFYGPFLTMYFLKVSYDSLTTISVYNIICYVLVGVIPLILGFLIKRRWQLATFRLGIVVNLAYIVFIMVMREGIVEHLGILALLFGASTALFYYPHNILSGAYVGPAQRSKFELTKKILVLLAGVVVPFLLGAFITVTDFALASGVIVVLSLIQVGLSLFLTPVETKKERFTPVRSLRTMVKDRVVRGTLWMGFLRGLTTSDSAMQVMMTLLIFNSFQTDLNLGIVTSVSNLCLIVLSFLYLRGRRWQGRKWVLLSFAAVPLVSLVGFLAFSNDLTLVLYYFLYSLASGMVQLLMTIRIYNTANRPAVRRGNAAEYWSFYELIQGVGRVLSFGLLLAAGMLGQGWLYALYVVLTLALFPIARCVREIED